MNEIDNVTYKDGFKAATDRNGLRKIIQNLRDAGGTPTDAQIMSAIIGFLDGLAASLRR